MSLAMRATRAPTVPCACADRRDENAARDIAATQAVRLSTQRPKRIPSSEVLILFASADAMTQRRWMTNDHRRFSPRFAFTFEYASNMDVDRERVSIDSGYQPEAEVDTRPRSTTTETDRKRA